MHACSRQMAEEVLKGGASEEDEGGAPTGGDQGFEGMEALARAIELGQWIYHDIAYLYVLTFPSHMHVCVVIWPTL